jgi:hypothetical protein
MIHTLMAARRAALAWMAALAMLAALWPLGLAAQPAPTEPPARVLHPAMERDEFGFRPMKTDGLEHMDGGGFHVWYPPAARKAAKNLIEDGPGHKARIWGELQHLGDERPIRVVLLEDLNDYFRRRGEPARAPEWAVGLALAQEDTVLVRWGQAPGGAWVEIDKTFIHELAHIGLDRATGEAGEHMDGGGKVSGGGRRVPRWFHEGFALAQANEWNLERGAVLVHASLMDRLIPLDRLHNGFPAEGPSVELAYAQGYEYVHHLREELGAPAFGRLMENLRAGLSWEEAFQKTYGRSFAQDEAEWRRGLDVAYTWFPVLAGSSVFWALGAPIFVVAWRRRRAQKREKLSQMAQDEPRAMAGFAQRAIPLPGMGLTAAHTRPKDRTHLRLVPPPPPEEPSADPAPDEDDGLRVFVESPHLMARDQDPELPRTAEGHTLH